MLLRAGKEATMRSSELRRSARSLVPALLLAAVAIPCRAIDFAEVELLGSSISQAGAPANFGFPSDSPDLVSSNDSETPIGVHGDHEDAEFMRDRLYHDAERVHAGRSFGSTGPARHGRGRPQCERAQRLEVGEDWWPRPESNWRHPHLQGADLTA